jgi:hypothetical protein
MKPPKGVKIVEIGDDPATVHNAIADAVGEPRLEREFSVCQFFVDGSYEYVRRYVTAKEAFDAFLHYTQSVGARIGTTARVIITDGGDSTNAEWIFGEGLTYPTRNPKWPGGREPI